MFDFHLHGTKDTLISLTLFTFFVFTIIRKTFTASDI